MEDIYIITKAINFGVCILMMCLICATASAEAACKVFQTTRVDCAYRDLTAVPSNLPSSTTHLDLSYNFIPSLTPGCFENLYSLEELTMYFSGDLTIDADALTGLQMLRSLIFRVPGNGHITFGNGRLKELPSLKTLEFPIKTFLNTPDDLLSNLKNLSKLKISIAPAYDGNQHSIFLPSSLFRGLGNLEELTVIGPLGWFSVNFSSVSFKDLGRLKSVNFDVYHLGCGDLEKLSTLRNIENIRMNQIRIEKVCNLDFSQFPRLKTVQLSKMRMDDQFQIFDWSRDCSHDLVVSVNWYNNEQRAKTLHVPRFWPGKISNVSITSTKRGGQSLACILNGLRNVTIRSLVMFYLLDRTKRHNLTQTTFENLAGSNIQEMSIKTENFGRIASNTLHWLAQLKTLHLSSCNLDDDAFVSLNGPMTLTTIRFRDNKFQNFTKLIAALSKLVNLRNIDASFNMFNGKIPEYAFRRHQSLTFINLRNNKFNFIEQKSFGSLSKLQYLDLSNNRIKMVSSGAFYALKTLTTLSFVGNSLLHQGEFEMSNYQLNNFSSLTTLTLGSRAFQNIGLPNSPHLESLHIANGQLPCCVKLFRENVRLEYLTLLEIQNVDFISHNEMGAIVNTDVINVQPRQCLRFLRLPNNNFKHLNFTSLNEFQNLEELLLTNNQLSFIYGVPNKLNKLASLDLSSNLITVLSPEIVTLLPSLRSLKVYDNPFDCTCKMKPFTDWLRKDQKVDVYHGGTRRKQNTCSLPRAQYGVSIDLIELGLECNLVFMISLPLTCFIVVVVIVAALVKRFHWRTHLAYFLFKLRPGGYNLQINDEEQAQNKKYDAFVVYNQHDSDWVIHELVPHLENIDPPNFKLCIHERDFIPGNDIFENVLDSIEQSKKTMLILSPDFAASEWCYFETRMAHSCLVEEKRDIIIMVSLKRIPDDEMPRILRNILLIKNYLEWPENEIGRKLFWEKLKVALRSDCKAKRVPDL